MINIWNQRPTIAQLRRDEPDREWTALRSCFGWIYRGVGSEDTIEIRPYADLTDDDDMRPGIWRRTVVK